MGKVMLFAPVDRPRLFARTGFYRNDVLALRGWGCRVVLGRTLGAALCRDYDGMLGYFYTWSVLAAVIARLRGRRVVLTGGADDFNPRHGLARTRRIIRRALLGIAFLVSDRVLLPTGVDRANVAAAIPRLSRRFPAKLGVAPHPLDAGRPAGSLGPRRWHAVTICWMGSAANVERKGVRAALDALVALRESGHEMTMSVLGTPGPGSSLVERWIAERGLERHVRLRGAVSEATKWEELGTAEAYFQLSSYEGFGVAALEALAAGCVVVHSGEGGLAETIADDGVLVTAPWAQRPGALADLGDRIQACRRRLDLRGEEIAARLRDRFSLEARAATLSAALGMDGPARGPLSGDQGRVDGSGVQ